MFNKKRAVLQCTLGQSSARFLNRNAGQEMENIEL